MSNSLSTMPLVLDTDFASFNEIQTLRPDGKIAANWTRYVSASSSVPSYKNASGTVVAL